MTSTETAARPCRYSRCARELPPAAGTGRTREYCAEEHWTDDDGHSVSCRKLATATQLLNSVHGDDVAAAPEFQELQAKLAETRGPIQALAVQLETTSTYLGEEVNTALTDAVSATARAEQADSRREAAEHRAAEDRRRADEAEDNERMARSGHEEALRAKRTAEDARLRADATTAELRTLLDTATEQNDSLREENGRLTPALAAVRATNTQLEEQVRNILAELAQTRSAHSDEVAELNTQHDRAREDLRRIAAAERDAAAAAHSSELARLHEQLGRERGEKSAQQEQLTETRKDTAAIDEERERLDRALRTIGEGLHTLSDAISDPDHAELRTQVEALRQQCEPIPHTADGENNASDHRGDDA